MLKGDKMNQLICWHNYLIIGWKCHQQNFFLFLCHHWTLPEMCIPFSVILSQADNYCLFQNLFFYSKMDCKEEQIHCSLHIFIDLQSVLTLKTWDILIHIFSNAFSTNKIFINRGIKEPNMYILDKKWEALKVHMSKIDSVNLLWSALFLNLNILSPLVCNLSAY